jgi:hypothetical protein
VTWQCAGRRDGQLVLWDVRRTRRRLACLRTQTLAAADGGGAGRRAGGSGDREAAHGGGVRGMLFVGRAGRLVSCGADARLRLWDTGSAARDGGALDVNYGSLERGAGAGSVHMAERGEGQVGPRAKGEGCL